VEQRFNRMMMAEPAFSSVINGGPTPPGLTYNP
jgi:hypothetical protein